jgi:hypothetical protein
MYFLSWMIILRHESVHTSRNPGTSAIDLISPHASRTGVCVCVFVCVCVCVGLCMLLYAYECVKVCNTHSVILN